MAKLAIDIRSVLIPVSGNQVLLPNATVAEVITFTDPDPFEDVPSWVLGRVTWRGWRVPVISLSTLGRWVGREGTSGAKIAVLKGLGGNADMPFMAIVTRGFPHLVTVSADSLEVVDGAEPEASLTEAAPVGDVETPAVATAGTEVPEFSGDGDDDLESFSVEMEFADLASQAPAGDDAEDSAPGGFPDEFPDPAGEATESVEETEDPGAELPPDVPEDFEAVASLVRVDGREAVIPDLLRIEKLVVQTIGRDKLRGR